MTDVATPLFLGEEPFDLISEALFLGWFLPYDPVADFPGEIHDPFPILDWEGVPLPESDVTHSQVHAKVEAELFAIDTKVGSGASTPTVGKILTGTGTGTSEWTDAPGLPTQPASPFVNESFYAPAAGQYGLGCVHTFGLVPTGTTGAPVMVWANGRYDSLVTVLVTAWDATTFTYDWWTTDGSTLVSAPIIQSTAYWLW